MTSKYMAMEIIVDMYWYDSYYGKVLLVPQDSVICF